MGLFVPLSGPGPRRQTKTLIQTSLKGQIEHEICILIIKGRFKSSTWVIKKECCLQTCSNENTEGLYDVKGACVCVCVLRGGGGYDGK